MTLPRLCDSILAQTRKVKLPGYDRLQLAPGIVHLGVGAFHRAHQAAYLDTIAGLGDKRWGIIGASLRSAGVREQLAPQDGLYTLLARAAGEEEARIVGMLRDILVAPESPETLIARMADPAARIVTLTITEKGYKIDPGSGVLIENDPEIRADLENPHRPVTAIGYLYAGLAARYRAGLKPFTVVSCDNLPHNGARTRAAVLQFAQRADRDVAAWIEAEGAFPSSMVDRIVPATEPEDVEALSVRTGYTDFGMVKTEMFSQWVIEDSFAGERPEFEAAGVQMVADVTAWEAAKLRLLNGAHSSLAYLGGLAGVRYIHECAADPLFADYLDLLWREARASLPPIPGFDAAAYCLDLKRRFANAALRHQTRQIAMDGSQKLPQRLLETLRIRSDSGVPSPAVLLGVAAWMRWLLCTDDAGNRHEVDDPMAGRLTGLAASGGGDPLRIVRALLGVREVFDAGLAENPKIEASLAEALAALIQSGARDAIRRTLSAAEAASS